MFQKCKEVKKPLFYGSGGANYLTLLVNIRPSTW